MINFEKVKEFHFAFGHPVERIPSLPSDREIELRLNLILEELLELGESFGGWTLNNSQWIKPELSDVDSKTLVGVADALADLEYVIHGTALVCGLPSQAVFDEVHRSNMSKLFEDGKPRYREDGKVLKGPNYSAPNIYKIIYHGSY